MKVYDYYITPEEYDTARSNGISKRVVNYRIRRSGWNKERAITEQIRRQNNHGDLVNIACDNGINKNTFYKRISLGWIPYEAATIPVKSKGDIINAMVKNRRKYPREILELAESNGISYGTFTCRVNKLKWDLVKAAITPIISPKEKGLLGKEKLVKYIDGLFKLNKADYMERCNKKSLSV